MSYRVLITPTARAQMLDQARWIAVECQDPEGATRWLEGIFDAAETLAEMPYRCSPAPENQYRDYEIRRLLVGNYLVLFTVAEEDQTVWVIGVRHGRRLPRPDELPDQKPSQESP